MLLWWFVPVNLKICQWSISQQIENILLVQTGGILANVPIKSNRAEKILKIKKNKNKKKKKKKKKKQTNKKKKNKKNNNILLSQNCLP